MLDDGTYAATHRGTGETVTARTWERLAGEATALRIAISLRGGLPDADVIPRCRAGPAAAAARHALQPAPPAR
ncbi:MAG: hypothetical protein DIU79_13895, partial [Actinobacteria bacterium]